MQTTLSGKTILLIISGGIAAYKSLELIRLLKKSGAAVRCVLTKGGAEFVTPLSVAALSEHPVYTDLWSLKDETEMGHIRLAREADLIVLAPASANLLARTAHGFADDLASTLLLANDRPVLACPAMNPVMWKNPATQWNVGMLRSVGMMFMDPPEGVMACGETGAGRLPEAEEIFSRIEHILIGGKPLAGRTALVTAGPTYEAIDPVRFIGNRSSGKQGYAIARALADRGAAVTLISGPTALGDPYGVKTVRIENAADMLKKCEESLPADIVVCAAAVADWSPAEYEKSKMKKTSDTDPSVQLTRNPDILSTLSSTTPRPKLIVGFAAETENLVTNARAKRKKKGCDWIVANAVVDGSPVFGADDNSVWLITSDAEQEWPRASKDRIARRLVDNIVEHFGKNSK